MLSRIYRPLSQPREIRLLFLSRGKFDDSLKIDLVHTTLDALSHKYRALSYVWGTQEDASSVETSTSFSGVHEKLSITRNLDTALPYLRDEDSCSVLWVDAICINQDDIVERGQQVAIMGEIYRLSHQVIAFLGPEADDSTYLLESMQSITRDILLSAESEKQKQPAWAQTSYVPALKLLTAIDERFLVACYHFSQRPWFYRLWIRQEITLGRYKARILCGRDSISWIHFSEFVSTFVKIPTKDFILYLRRTSLTTSMLLNAVSGASEVAYTSWKPFTYRSLRSSSRYAQCVDPRDRIYANLNLLHMNDTKICVQPDYTIKVEQVYRNVVLEVLRKTRSLQILNQCQHKERMRELPSWVPDWSTAMEDFKTSTAAPEALGVLPKSTERFLQADCDMRLKLHGMRCGGIEGVFHLGILDDIKYARDTLLATTCIQLGISTTFAWLASLPEIYPTGESKADAFAQTVCLDDFADKWTPLRSIGINRRTAIHEIKEMLFAGGFFSPSSTFLMAQHETSVVDLLQTTLGGRKFFVTSDGHFGMAPAGAQEGDEIYWLFGSDRPLILRKTDGAAKHFIIIGYCYLHGMMHGEILLGPLSRDVRQLLVQDDQNGDNKAVYVDRLPSEAITYAEPWVVLTQHVLDPRLPDFFKHLVANGYNGPLNPEGLCARDFVHDLQRAGYAIESLTLV